MNKVADLLERLERVRLNRENASDPDPLSESLWEYFAELAALGEAGLAAAAAELGVTPEDVVDMAQNYVR